MRGALNVDQSVDKRTVENVEHVRRMRPPRRSGRSSLMRRTASAPIRWFPASRAAKRGLDIGVALAALLFTAPLLVALAVAIRLQDGGPALFRQLRIGRAGRPFTCFKFRSMALDADARLTALLLADPRAAEEWRRDQKLRHDPRVLGALGRFLRRSSLDELPQLINVIRGDMSLVGPRPIVETEIPRYSAFFRYYTAVRPGVTGLWQVLGRNDVAYARRVRLDAAYVRKRAFLLDLWILWRTLPAVLLRRGAS